MCCNTFKNNILTCFELKNIQKENRKVIAIWIPFVTFRWFLVLSSQGKEEVSQEMRKLWNEELLRFFFLFFLKQKPMPIHLTWIEYKLFIYTDLRNVNWIRKIIVLLVQISFFNLLFVIPYWEWMFVFVFEYARMSLI